MRQPCLPTEAVILGLGGMILAVAAALLPMADGGTFPFYASGMDGLLLVLIAFQTVALGKTPLGPFGRSSGLLAAAGALAALGVAACCLPSFRPWPRLLLLACFGVGGGVLLIRMWLAADGARRWLRQGGLFRRLAVCCAASYLFAILTAIILWRAQALSALAVAMALSCHALALFCLAAVLRTIYCRYPDTEGPVPGRVDLTATQSILLLLGLFMVLLGLLLIPVNLGWLAFAPSAQIGLLMVFFALQMLLAGETPLGVFPRNGLTIVCGLLFATAGIVSCLIPDLLLRPLTGLVGALNMANGALTLFKCRQAIKQGGGERRARPSHALRLLKLQCALGVLALLFGASMLLPGVVPGLVIAVILTANGGVLLCLLHLLVRLDACSRPQA